MFPLIDALYWARELDAIPVFNFKSSKNLDYKTLITQEMLKDEIILIKNIIIVYW